MAKVGFIGLGNMGMPMARNLLKKTGSLIAFNRSAEKTAAIVKEGAEAAIDAADVAKKADIILLSLPGPAQVDEVVRTLIENGKEGQIIIDLSTVSPKLNREMAKRWSWRMPWVSPKKHFMK